jgi:hypothetical protein
MATTIDRTVRSIGGALRENFSTVINEPLPTEFTECLRRLALVGAVKVSGPNAVVETKVANAMSRTNSSRRQA